MDKARTHEIRSDTLLTSYQVGSLLQVNPSSINKWVKDGRIPAFRTPGGHRRIRASDLVAFLGQHQMPVPRDLAKAAQRRLLIVDADQAASDRLVRSLQGRAGSVRIETASSGIDALVLIGSLRPHAVVLDADASDVDGLAICRRLKANADTRDVKVVLTSATVTSAFEQKARAAGADHCVAKPPREDVLLSALGI